MKKLICSWFGLVDARSLPRLSKSKMDFYTKERKKFAADIQQRKGWSDKGIKESVNRFVDTYDLMLLDLATIYNAQNKRG